MSYALAGVDNAPYVKYCGTGVRPDQLVRTVSGLKTAGRETSGQVGGEYRLGKGWVQSLEAGLRYADHRRDSARRYPAYHDANLQAGAPTGTIPWPSNFGAGP